MKKIQLLLFSLFVLVGTLSFADYSEAANSWVCSNASCSIRGTSCPTAGQTTACPSPTGVLALARLYRPMLLGQCPVLPQAILVARARHVRLVPVTQAQIRRMLVGHVLVETTQALPNVAPVVAEEAEQLVELLGSVAH